MARFSLLGLAVLLIATQLQAANAQCTQRRIRKEIYDLSPSEAQSFVTGMQALYAKGGFAEKMVAMHQSLYSTAHLNAQFFPWHRVMVYMTETELLKHAPEGLPYWDAANQWLDYASAFPFRDDMMGSIHPPGGCLTGPFAGLTVNGQCVSRAGPATQLVDPRLIAGLMAIKDYDTFRIAVEGNQHAFVHNGIQGSMSDIRVAPSDPMFWLHHGAMDYYWASWQGVNSQANYKLYNGPNPDGNPVSLSDTFQGYSVDQIADYYNTFCYAYQPARNALRGQVPFALGAMGNSVTPDANNTANSNTTAPPLDNTAIQLPPALPDSFLKTWNMTAQQAKEAQSLLQRFAAILQDQQKSGKKLPTLATIATSQVSTDPPASPPPNNKSAASPRILPFALLSLITATLMMV
ncbi:hypothetical protein RI367_007739 [Sorochytrium milnesiophthora]